jgi:hypothetical protein
MSIVNDVFSASAEIGFYSAKEEALSRVHESIYGIKAKVFEKVSAGVSFIPKVTKLVGAKKTPLLERVEKQFEDQIEEAKGREAEERIKAKYYRKAKITGLAVAAGTKLLPPLENLSSLSPPEVFHLEGGRLSELAGSFYFPDVDFPQLSDSTGESRFNFSYLKRLKPSSQTLSRVSEGVSKVATVVSEGASKVATLALENKYVGKAFSYGAEKGVEMGVSAIVDQGVDSAIAPLQESMEEGAGDVEAKVRSKLDCCCVKRDVDECISDVKTVVLFRTRGCRNSSADCVHEAKSVIRQKVFGLISFFTHCCSY